VLPVNCDNPTRGDVENDHLYVSPEKLCDLGCETPRINEFNIGKKYRFFYAISSDVDAENPGTVIIAVGLVIIYIILMRCKTVIYRQITYYIMQGYLN